MIRSTGINDIKSNGCSHEPNTQVEVDVAESGGYIAFET